MYILIRSDLPDLVTFGIVDSNIKRNLPNRPKLVEAVILITENLELFSLSDFMKYTVVIL